MTYSTHTTGGVLIGAITLPMVAKELSKITIETSNKLTPKLISSSLNFLYPEIEFSRIEPYILLFITFCIIGSIFPDIDHPKSKISKKTKPIAFIFNKLFKHRGFIHTPILYILLFVIIEYFRINKNYTFSIELFAINIGFFIGCMTHLILDSFNKTGISWAYPITRKKFSLVPIKTGGIGETIFEILQIVILISFFLVQKNLIIINF